MHTQNRKQRKQSQNHSIVKIVNTVNKLRLLNNFLLQILLFLLLLSINLQQSQFHSIFLKLMLVHTLQKAVAQHIRKRNRGCPAHNSSPYYYTIIRCLIKSRINSTSHHRLPSSSNHHHRTSRQPREKLLISQMIQRVQTPTSPFVILKARSIHLIRILITTHNEYPHYQNHQNKKPQSKRFPHMRLELNNTTFTGPFTKDVQQNTPEVE